MVRIAWGGGEKIWEGSISVSSGVISQPRPLGLEADEPGSMWLDQGRLIIRQRSPRTYDGVDIIVTAPADAKLVVQLTAAGDAQRGGDIELPLSEISTDLRRLPLDKQQNQLFVQRTPGDALLVRIPRSSLVFAPGETLRGKISPHLLPLPSESGLQISMQLLDAQQHARWSNNVERHSGAETVPLEVKLPEDEGVYDLVITAQAKAVWSRTWRNSLQWKRPSLERRVQLIVISGRRPQPTAAGTTTILAEIDPTIGNWWEKAKFARWPRLGRARSEALGNGMRQTIHHSLGDLSQLKPSAASPDLSWEAYPLTVSCPGKPHVLEVDYPSDVPQTLGISVLDSNAAGALAPIGLDSGIEVSAEAASVTEPHWEHHRIVFWPRTNAPLVLLTNRRQQSPAAYGKLRVLAAGDHLVGRPSESAQESARNRADGFGAPSYANAPQQRLFAAYMDRPLLAENFSAPEVPDPWSGRMLADWRTFHQAGTRLIEYLRYAGHNGLVLAVAADGSAIYPSQVLEPTPRYDSGVFLAGGQDPMPKDVLEMLLRMMDREGLQLIPSVEFAAPLPGLEAIRRRGGTEAQGLEWIGPDGNTWQQTYGTRRGLAPYYNLLDPRVQEAMLAAVRELATRYAGHASFRGLALRLSAYGYAQLPGPEWGLDDATIARFEHEGGVKLPGEGDGRYATRAAFLATEEHRLRWLQWRAEQCHKFYQRVQETLAAARPGMPLYLAGAETLAGPDMAAEMRPGLLKQPSLATGLLQVGIDPALYRDEKVILLRAQRVGPATPLTAQAVELELSQSTEADAFFRAMPQPGSLFFHPPLEANLPTFDQKAPFRGNHLALLSQIVPSAVENRRRFVESLAGHDSQLIVDGGWMLPLGQEDSTQRLAAGFRKLPPVHFIDAEESRPGQPVVFRYAMFQGKTYAYAINLTPFVTTCRVVVAATSDCRLEDLCGDGHSGQLKVDGGGSLWNVELQPYDLAAVCLSDPNARLLRPEALPNDRAVQWLAGRIRELGARAAVLRSPPPLTVVENAGFQAKPTAAEAVPGWAVSRHLGIAISTDTTQGHAAEGSAEEKGQQSAKISSDGPVACLVSRPFAPPRSGRLAMSVWLKLADASRQPNLRLAVEGKLAGRDYYRFATLGQPSATGQRGAPLAATWRRFIVPFNDLPIDGMSQMRVRLDLMGAGEVWADDVQLFDLAFNESELRAVYKLLALAQVALQNGETGETLKLLHGYWPRLEENVVLPAATPTVAARTGGDDAAPASDLMGRMKGAWR